MSRNSLNTLRCYPRKAVSLVVFLTAVGCSREPTVTPPKTYPLTGRVVISGRPLPVNSRIQFHPEDPELLSSGKIGVDGSFSLSFLFRNKKLPGAAEGPHEVIVVTPLSVDQKGGERIVLKQSYTVEPKENHFTIPLDYR